MNKASFGGCQSSGLDIMPPSIFGLEPYRKEVACFTGLGFENGGFGLISHRGVPLIKPAKSLNPHKPHPY